MAPIDEAAGDILAALSNVIDPELGIDFVDLGLVYSVTEEEDTIHVLFTLTSPGCPIGPDVTRQISEEIIAVRPGRVEGQQGIHLGSWTDGNDLLGYLSSHVGTDRAPGGREGEEYVNGVLFFGDRVH